MEIHDIRDLAQIFGGAPEPSMEEQQAQWNANIAFIKAAFAGDDMDAKVVRHFISLVNQTNEFIADNVRNDEPGLRVAKAIQKTVMDYIDAQASLVSHFLEIATVRANALGIKYNDFKPPESEYNPLKHGPIGGPPTRPDNAI